MEEDVRSDGEIVLDRSSATHVLAEIPAIGQDALHSQSKCRNVVAHDRTTTAPSPLQASKL